MRKEINVTLGKRVWDSRKKLKLTREQLSEKINVSVRFLADVENGDAGVSLTTLKLLCDTLNVSADYLLGSRGDISQEDYARYSLMKKAEKIPPEHMECTERILDEIINITQRDGNS